MLLPFRLAFLPVKILLFVAKTLGYTRFAMFLIGVFVGLACAPTTGAQFRARVRDLVQGDQPEQPALP